MNLMVALKWALIAYVLFQGVRYLMKVRIYLVYAFRALRATPITREQIDPGALDLLTSLDDSLAAAGFRHLGFAQSTSILTYCDKAAPFSVYVNDAIPAYAAVGSSQLPTYQTPVELQLSTYLESGVDLSTFNGLLVQAFLPPDMRVGSIPGASVAMLAEEHQRRIAAEADGSIPAQHPGFEHGIQILETHFKRLRAQFRERGWTVSTSDDGLDRFTLLGAFSLARASSRLVGAPRKAAAMAPAPPPPTAAERRFRIEADMRAVLAVAENPEPVPGIPWPLITVATATAVLSWVAMGLMFDFYFATLALAVIAIHEAGHATAMRLFGYRDVHIFFVPLLGALTLGRPLNSSIRDRLVVLLAGPIPGLWLGLILAVIGKMYFHTLLFRAAPALLLILNGLNLLPFAPLDGGRVIEALTRPESVWRLVILIVGAVAILALGLHFRDPLLSGVGVFLLALVRQQWRAWQLRREVAAVVRNKTDFREVARITLETLTANPRYAAWRPGARQATARAFGRSFAEPAPTAADRVWGAVAYVSAWIPIGAWFALRAS